MNIWGIERKLKEIKSKLNKIKSVRRKTYNLHRMEMILTKQLEYFKAQLEEKRKLKGEK
jgi:hypothetical protein